MSRLDGLYVLDAGCGEGKNAAHLVQHNCIVDAVDISAIAIAHGRATWGPDRGINWINDDIRAFVARRSAQDQKYDVVIAYGLLHCLRTAEEVARVVDSLRRLTTPGGYQIVCAFNARKQELAAHPDLTPVLLAHRDYLALYGNDDVIFESDQDLTETHPHNNISHTHSMTRLIVRIAPYGD